MKTTQRRIGITWGSLILGGWLAGTTIAPAQEAGPPPGPPHGPPPPRMDGAPAESPQAARMRMAMGRVEELRRAGKHDEARQLAERLRAAGAQRPPQANRERNVGQPQVRGQGRERRNPAPPADPVAQTRMKMQQLRQAADLLHAAGYPDHAAKVRLEIERIAAESRRAAEKEQARADGEREKSRREAAAKENAGMREEMKRMRREVEELRDQLKKMKDRDTGSRTP